MPLGLKITGSAFNGQPRFFFVGIHKVNLRTGFQSDAKFL